MEVAENGNYTVVSSHTTLSTIEGRNMIQTEQSTHSIKDLPADMYLLQIRSKDGRVIKTEKII